MTARTDFSERDMTGTTYGHMVHQPYGKRPGVATYLVLMIWSGVVVAAILGGVYAGAGASRLALPASVALPLALVAIGFRASSRFREYVMTLDLRLVLAAQLWRVIGVVFLFAWAFDELPAGFAVPAGVGDIATGLAAIGVVLALGDDTLTRGKLYAFTALGVGDFLVAFATGLALEPAAMNSWPLAVFPTLVVPFFAVLHLVAVLQSRHNWEDTGSNHHRRAGSG